MSPTLKEQANENTLSRAELQAKYLLQEILTDFHRFVKKKKLLKLNRVCIRL
jgi:hypothetical protein